MNANVERTETRRTGIESAYLTPAELRERFGGRIADGTLRNWRYRGEGPPFVKLGGKVLYPVAEVEKWEASRRLTKASQRTGKAA